MRAERLDFPGAGGAMLAARLDSPEGAIRAYALFAHCFTCGKDVFAASRIAQALTDHGIAVLRFQFPFMEQGSRRPDTPAVAQAAVRTAVAEAAQRLPGVPPASCTSVELKISNFARCCSDAMSAYENQPVCTLSPLCAVSPLAAGRSCCAVLRTTVLFTSSKR